MSYHGEIKLEVGVVPYDGESKWLGYIVQDGMTIRQSPLFDSKEKAAQWLYDRLERSHIELPRLHHTGV